MEAFVDYAYATITSTSGIRSVAAITGRHAYCTVPGESTFEHDFVSMLDLGNSSLDVFPYTMGIDAEVTSGQMIDFVNKLKQDNCNRSLLEYLATFDIDASSEFILKPMPNQRLVGDAVLINGRFRGKLWSEGDRLMAQWVGDETPDADGELFELDILEWRYLDVNRDGFRDVVIFFMVNSYCDWIVLTRKTSTQSRFDEVGTVAVSE
ncbi:MAG: hypothetical protein SFY80_15105 [Verrucomicrobiota bacterium]|nr:hypothetical protein [Verrucomicrobiota bacterium]